ncbi:PEGA domain-containing protein [Methanofollis fontis]|uniref:PEGA domain-containing protein n=1 Tax=Methanofollis fontis TaxID=2052832 RepID=A0A483CNA2_9EURY|nr:PEGA domain-containing protein [Methanofollis fontis]TAJ43451.1 hypothetical protein CUJ86_10680 [Methanofollis fontis]
MIRKAFLLTGGALVLLLLTASVSAATIGGDEAWIQVSCNVDGASIYFDNDYKGQISSGQLNVPVYTTGTPYYTAKATMDGYYTSSTSIGSYPAAGETKTIYITLNPVPTPVPPSTGTLSVTSSPSGAKTYVDGSYYGRTPQVISGLSVGSHSVQVSLDGYTTFTQSAGVSAGGVTNVYAVLSHEPSQGSIYVTSSPSGAYVYLDGSYQGTTPKTITGVDQGTHVVEIEKAGYQEWSGSVRVYPSQQAHVSVSLTPDSQPTSGTIAVYSDPVGAYIYLDGTYQGRTYPEGFVVIGVSPGSHEVKLTLSGYQDSITSVNVNSGQQSTVSSTLTPVGADTGSMEITSEPAGATVYLNNANKGVTPLTLSSLQVGSYTVTLKLNGYADWSTTATVNAGTTTPVSAQLVQTPPPTTQSAALPVTALGALAILGAVVVLRRRP